MDLSTLTAALRKSWNKDTCHLPISNNWSNKNRALGQCIVTALIVQDYFGGEILHCKHTHHHWNRISTGEEIDLTKEQFPPGTKICVDDINTRDFLLTNPGAIKSETLKRYLILKESVEKNLL
ncbi:MAG: YunG family protein [Candidatus Nanoarchaeia archaeon]